MWKKIVHATMVAIGFIAGIANASEHGTEQEAVAMVQKVVALVGTEGKDKVIAEINAGQGKFRDRDLYVSITDLRAHSLANGANQKLVGKDLLELKDADGKAFMRERLAMLKTTDRGWIDYKWPNPVSGKIDRKLLYFERVGDVVVSCGIYKQ